MTLRLALAVALCVATPAAVSAQTAQAAETTQPAPVAPSLPQYRILPGDELEIFVWGEERLQRVVRVLPDGSFAFPLVGRIEAANRLPSEIEAIVARGVGSLYQGAVPQVTVSVRNPAGLQFSVVGKVRNPGTFTPGRYVNALEALSLAGGPTEFAQLGGIIILRKEGQGLRAYRIRLGDVFKGTPAVDMLAAEGIPQIQSGDTVVVP